jgi:hypothetical protein
VESLRATMAAVPEDEVLQMASGNAAVVHGIDVEQLQPLAGRFGPAPELVTPALSAGLDGFWG